MSLERAEIIISHDVIELDLQLLIYCIIHCAIINKYILKRDVLSFVPFKYDSLPFLAPKLGPK